MIGESEAANVAKVAKTFGIVAAAETLDEFRYENFYAKCKEVHEIEPKPEQRTTFQSS